MHSLRILLSLCVVAGLTAAVPHERELWQQTSSVNTTTLLRRQMDADAVVPGENGYAGKYVAKATDLGSCAEPLEVRVVNRVKLPSYSLRDPVTNNERGSCGKCLQVCFQDAAVCRQYLVVGLCSACHRGNVLIEQSGLPAGLPGPSGVTNVAWKFVNCVWSQVNPRY